MHRNLSFPTIIFGHKRDPESSSRLDTCCFRLLPGSGKFVSRKYVFFLSFFVGEAMIFNISVDVLYFGHKVVPYQL